ncbi:hypothetical protein L1987_19229 [Smallanthus sonchifolius]|uniref:Uncharacterized protein n=1 Tax=Smallanthus sonchifolius TaxID=185202 RepID=A0ACB9IN10_9ASTR|nr:hypothetical protein L1987_19229 [Smallanthus sonchifolius]
MTSSHSISVLSLCFHFLFSISRALVPSSETFTYVNEGEFGRGLSRSRPFPQPVPALFLQHHPKCIHSSSPYGHDGNLVLAEADGRVVWQTNTANKGVVGFELLPNGNMVLHDAKGNFVWQSFDSPTDTLLVGQSLLVDGVNKLVSWASVLNNLDGPYSFVMESRRIALYYKSNNSPRPMLYWANYPWIYNDTSTFTNLTLVSEPRYPDDFSIYYLHFLFNVTNSNPLIEPSSSNQVFTRYNNTLTYVRLGIDGNLRYFTYSPNVQNMAWDPFYTLLDRDSMVGECQLPERCGKLGLCEDNQCVACPTPNGLSGWSKDCEAKKVTSCKASDFYYYKLEGVDHFMIKQDSFEVLDCL